MAIEPFRSMREEMRRMMEELWEMPWPTPFIRRTMPLCDVYEQNNNWVVECAMPGVRPEDVDISVAGNTVTLRGRRECPVTKGDSYTYHELGCGEWQRTITLPETVNADQAQATFEHGLVRIVLPKVVAARHIPVKAVGARSTVGQTSGGR